MIYLKCNQNETRRLQSNDILVLHFHIYFNKYQFMHHYCDITSLKYDIHINCVKKEFFFLSQKHQLTLRLIYFAKYIIQVCFLKNIKWCFCPI